jgi:hypothetical protein
VFWFDYFAAAISHEVRIAFVIAFAFNRAFSLVAYKQLPNAAVSAFP